MSRRCSTSATGTSRRSRTTARRSSTRSTASCATALNARVGAIPRRPGAWVAIVTGAGRAFCVGADLHDGAGSHGHVVRARSGRSRPSTRSSRAWRSGSRRSPRSTATASGYGLTARQRVRLRGRGRRRPVRHAGGATRLADHRRGHAPARAGRHATRARAAADRRPDRRRPGEGDRPRRVGRAARRPARPRPAGSPTGSARAHPSPCGP